MNPPCPHCGRIPPDSPLDTVSYQLIDTIERAVFIRGISVYEACREMGLKKTWLHGITQRLRDNGKCKTHKTDLEKAKRWLKQNGEKCVNT